MQFKLIIPPAGSRQSARFDESLIALAAQHGPVASVWEAEQGLIVPRTYQRHEKFARACAAFAKQSWPITVRLSGGGIVPQGPGILNLSLAYAVQGLPMDHSNTAYQRICRIISQALEKFGIATQAQAVSGSFCDGRYNLAWGNGAQAKKVAGTAQLWRRMKAETMGHPVAGNELQETPFLQNPATRYDGPIQVVLVHALIFGTIDAALLTDKANQFEEALDRNVRYDPARIASLYGCLRQPLSSPAEFIALLASALIGQLEDDPITR